MLDLKKISKIYETGNFKQKALDNVSISFRKCEFVSILGPSGSGKTTLLNIIGGLDKYTTGDLIINNISTKKYKDKDWDSYRNHRVGFVFQSYNLISHQSILANVELALTLSGVSRKERKRRAKRALKEVGLEKHINKRPNQLSGGQMQRVAIARALVNDPEIIMADEPTGALDSKTSTQIMDLLKEVAKDRLVIMVTHNKDLAESYSTRIIELKDGVILGDSNPYKNEDKELEKAKKNKKKNMSMKTALSLSLNNLMTKKGRTILTAFAGSIGIIGISLILSLSNGIQNYIDDTEKETLSSYPLTIEKESIDMSEMIKQLSGQNESKKYKDGKVHSFNIMGNMFTTMSEKVKTNDIKGFKEYIESDKTDIDKYTTSIQYGYDVTLNLYKNDTENITQVNPTKVFDAIGMGTDGISSAYDSYMSNYNVFNEMIDNEQLNKQQYELVDGTWPKNYNELVLVVGENLEIPDYTLYSLGILSQDELKEQFSNMTSGKRVEFKEVSYDTKDLIGLTFKLVLNTDYYAKKNNLWIDMSDDESYMKEVISNSEELKIVGIIKPNSEAIVNTSTSGTVLYKPELMTHLVEKINDTEIAKEQKENKDKNVFTGGKFQESKDFDINNLSSEQLSAMQNMSDAELAEYMKSYTENIAATYEENLKKLGISDKDNPDKINIYPKDFESKEEITKIIDKYNKDKKEKDKIEYTDMVGIMMSSVSTIVNVISSVLIAFVAISLIVSSIMIAIITYISVMERTKEIGILRAIGASKKDISRVFNAETLIEGFVAGVLGIIVTILLNIPINMIIKNMVDISNIAKLSVGGSIILIIISVLLTMIAGLIPAKIASKKDPVESLRSE